MVRKDSERGGVRQRKRRHIESHTKCVQCHEDCFVGSGAVHAHHEKTHHEHTRNEMAIAKQALRLDKSVGYDAHQRRHEDRHDTLYRIKPRNLGTHTGSAKIITHRSEVSSPHGELQEVHQCQTHFNIHNCNSFLFPIKRLTACLQPF